MSFSMEAKATWPIGGSKGHTDHHAVHHNKHAAYNVLGTSSKWCTDLASTYLLASGVEKVLRSI